MSRGSAIKASLWCPPVAERTPIHLRPSAPLAERVLLPGDPRRALLVAQAILEEPRMFNHARGLWGYTGRAADGELLTIQATGMGGPSAAIVVEELIGLGAHTLLRIGTCGALTGEFELGELVTADRALGADGASASLGVTDTVEADPGLTAALVGAGARAVTAVSTDLFYDENHDGAAAGWVRAGAGVVEMEAATLLTVARRRGARAGVLLGVTDLLAGGRRRLDDEGVETLGLELGRAAWAALDGG
jgi:uridine phosphorylase